MAASQEPHPMSAQPPWQHWLAADWSEFPPSDPSQVWIWGYTDRLSYLPGDQVHLHVNTSEASYCLKVVRDGGDGPETVYERAGLAGKRHDTPRDASAVGCGWPVAHTIDVPASWRTGGYAVLLTLNGPDGRPSKQAEAFFVLRSAAPVGERPDIAFVVATSTWIAYNNWGGGSSYSALDVDFTDSEKSRDSGLFPELSTQRPWPRGFVRIPNSAPRLALKTKPPPNWVPTYPMMEWAMANGYSLFSRSAGWATYDGLMAAWLERSGYSVAYLTQHDLHMDPTSLDGHKVVLTCGHDEYWSRPARLTLDHFIERGGRLARFGGNIIWQVRISEDGRTQTCYKYSADRKDPLAKDPQQNTNAFEAASVRWPPALTFGVNGVQGVYSRFGGFSPRGLGGFTVYRNEHWAFEGADLYYGDTLGEEVPLVGFEGDGLAYTFRHGLPYPTGEDGAPADKITILALTPICREEEDHGHLPPGLTLFNGAGDWEILTEVVHGKKDAETLAKTRYGSCVISHMVKGSGEVFCAGTTEWPFALEQGEWYVNKITHNVLRRFIGQSKGTKRKSEQ